MGMQLDEPSARQVILVQALETADRQGKLFSAEDRAQADRFARDGQPVRGPLASADDTARLVKRRAQMVIKTLEIRHPEIAALQSGKAWASQAAVVLAVLAFALGVVTDRVANPHRVDLLSLPLLGILLWNVVVYVLLLVQGLTPAKAHGAGVGSERGPGTTLARWLDGGLRWRRGKGLARTEVTARFYALWQGATAALNGQRVRRVLHLAAAAWGAGIAASLFARGLVVEYRVGWESTFLDAAQVHAILSVLFTPLVWLFSLAPFTVADVALLRFDHGGTAEAGARWVYLYATLLVLVVLLPRGVLAALAWRRERQLQQRVAIDLAAPYFQQVVANLMPVRVGLGALTDAPADLQWLRRVFLQHTPAALPRLDAHGRLPPCVMLRSGDGDEWVWQEQAPTSLPAEGNGGGMVAWAQRAWQGVRQVGANAAQEQAPPPDVVLVMVNDATALQAQLPALKRQGQPVLVLTPTDAVLGACRAALQTAGVAGTVLAQGAVAHCWAQETALLAALADLLPPGKVRGFSRLQRAWANRQRTRFQQAMALLAKGLCDAARMQETVQAEPLSARHVVDADERKTYAMDKQTAMAAVQTRLAQHTAEATRTLLHLHGAEPGGAGWVGQALPDNFVVHQAVNASQAGMAGAASGAAMGVSLDLLVGGLSLGAGAALGALVGGGAAWVGAAWKNRAASAGATVVQLSDPMLLALLEASLLRYLAVIHLGRLQPPVAAGEVLPQWTEAVVSMVQAADDQLAPVWTAARRPGSDDGAAAEALTALLVELGQAVLHHLYPDTALSPVDEARPDAAL